MNRFRELTIAYFFLKEKIAKATNCLLSLGNNPIYYSLITKNRAASLKQIWKKQTCGVRRSPSLSWVAGMWPMKQGRQSHGNGSTQHLLTTVCLTWRCRLRVCVWGEVCHYPHFEDRKSKCIKCVQSHTYMCSLSDLGPVCRSHP